MTSSIFTDRSAEPDASQLADVLGETYQHWTGLLDHLEQAYGPLTAEWKIYSRKSG